MKRILVLHLILTLIMTALLSGCETKMQASEDKSSETLKQEITGGENRTAENTEKDKTVLTLWTFLESHKQFWKDASIDWNKDNPKEQITFKGDVYPYDVMHNKLQIALQSGMGAPDLVDIELTRYPLFLKGNISLVSLNNIIIPIKDKLIMGRFENYAKDGNYYGVDYHVGATVAYYNKEILAKANVNPDDIKLWSDFVTAGKKVVEKTGKPMTTIEVTNMWSYYPLISQQGSDYLNRDGSVQLDNKVNIKTLQFLKHMVYEDKIAVLAPGGEHNKEEYYEFMNNGGAASVIMPLWYMGRFTDYMPDLKGKMVIRPMPAWKAGGFRSAGMGGTGTSITNQCKDKDLALAFLAASKLTEKGAIKCWTILGFDPVFNVVYSDPALSADNKYTQYFGKDIFNTAKLIIDEINTINIAELFPDAATGVARTVMYKALKEQSQTPEEALKSFADELRKIGAEK